MSHLAEDETERRAVRLAADGEQVLAPGPQLPPGPWLAGLVRSGDDLFEQVAHSSND